MGIDRINDKMSLVGGEILKNTPHEVFDTPQYPPE
jgi:hypothetical protein